MKFRLNDAWAADSGEWISDAMHANVNFTPRWTDWLTDVIARSSSCSSSSCLHLSVSVGSSSRLTTTAYERRWDACLVFLRYASVLTDRQTDGLIAMLWWRCVAGDIVLEIDGHLIRTEKALSVILHDRIGRITVAMIAVESTGRLRPQGSGRLRQARDLFAKVYAHVFLHYHCDF